MIRTLRWFTVWCLALFAAPALAATPALKDRAHLFSAEAAAEAKTIVAEIHDQLRTDVAVETVSAVPFYKDPWGKVKTMSPAEQEAFVQKWAKSRLPGRNSLFIFIVRAPGLQNVQVLSGRSLLARRAFTMDDCQAVRERLETELAGQQFDDGLLSGLRLAHVLLENRLGDNVPEPFDGQLALAIGVFVAGVLLAVRIARGSWKWTPTHPVQAEPRPRAPARPAVRDGPLPPKLIEPMKDWA